MLSAILGSEISKGIQRAIIIVAILAVLLLAAWIYFKSQGKMKGRSAKDQSDDAVDNSNEAQSSVNTTASVNQNAGTSSPEQRGTHIKNSRITYVEQARDNGTERMSTK